jgi:hypothetical protein
MPTHSACPKLWAIAAAQEELSELRRLSAISNVGERFAMPRKKHGVIIQTSTEARQAERGTSVLLLLTVSLIAVAIGVAAVWYIFFRT